MQLSDLVTETLAHGFDPTQFGKSRIVQYINDSYQLVCSTVQYNGDEAVQDFPTVAGTATYAMPANLNVIRSLRNTQPPQDLRAVTIRQLDRASPTTGTPLVYAVDGNNLRLYPTPDSGSYPLELRYWLAPANLIADTDVPIIPAMYHDLLWMYATSQSYKAEDDFQLGAQWRQDFDAKLKVFSADMKSLNSDAPTQASSMWAPRPGLSRGWSITGIGS